MSTFERFLSLPETGDRTFLTWQNRQDNFWVANNERRVFQTCCFFPNLFSHTGPALHIKNCGIFKSFLMVIFCLPSHIYSLATSILPCALGRLTSMGCHAHLAFSWVEPRGGTGRKVENRRRRGGILSPKPHLFSSAGPTFDSGSWGEPFPHAMAACTDP